MRIDHTLWVWIQGIHDVEGEWLQLYEEQITIVKDGREQPMQRCVAHGLDGRLQRPSSFRVAKRSQTGETLNARSGLLQLGY